MSLSATSIFPFFWDCTCHVISLFRRVEVNKLFPGSSKSQSKHASAILKRMLKEHMQQWPMTPLTSILSGKEHASTYLASPPGGLLGSTVSQRRLINGSSE
jgi:hypothetical protein